MKTIPLTQGKFAIVDDEDYERVSKHRWLAHRYKAKSGVGWHARRTVYDENGKRIRQGMHSFILDTVREIDHKDRNGLNNQRLNLRFSDKSLNQMNKVTPSHSSKFKGVWYLSGRKHLKRWSSSIRFRRQQFYLGVFRTEREAALAYDAEAVRLCGEFALTNQKMGLL